MCVAPECSTSADCTSSDAPVCVGQLCVAACTGDMDCTGAAGGSYCASNGMCVACTMDSQCTAADAPVCDMTTNACRECKEDSECMNGVCLEADGTCAPDSQVVYVVAGDGNDSGTCTAAAPCATLGYALGEITATRNVMHVAGTVSLGTSTLTITKPIYLEGVNATLEGYPSSGPAIAIPASLPPMTISGVMLTSTTGQGVSVAAGASLRVFDLTASASITVSNAALDVERSTFSNAGVTCSSGTLTVNASTFSGVVNGTNCQVVVHRSSFTSADETINTMGGLVVIDNSVFIETQAYGDSIHVMGGAPGTTFQFNTVVNIATLSSPSDGQALYCDDAVAVTSNIFAYGSMHPQNGCTSQYSLYDTVALSQFTGGTGDKVADSSTFFVDGSSMNFHLAPGSPALMSAETGLPVTVDYEGNPRPNPVGSTPDIGAYEAP
ncbi:MAG TPA: choice-of-anchor Q domain-containing protein [Kofleriaceae bacterium]|nr:choice-of-anchor Q domain-containing protein [Kofleriaceae bacterium]